MEARRFVLGSAILGLFWSGLFKGALTNSMNRCDYPPCSCDSHGRLTCDCKEEGEVCSYVDAKRLLLLLLSRERNVEIRWKRREEKINKGKGRAKFARPILESRFPKPFRKLHLPSRSAAKQPRRVAFNCRNSFVSFTSFLAPLLGRPVLLRISCFVPLFFPTNRREWSTDRSRAPLSRSCFLAPIFNQR